MSKQAQREFHTYYFIESHPKSLNNQVEVVLNVKHSSIQPLRKLIEKDFKSSNDEDFTVTVYAGDIFPSLIKEKEVKIVQNYIKAFPVKIAKKIQKNKFEGKVNAYLPMDCFVHFVNFDPIKKLIGKNIDPPPQIELLPFQYMSLFNEVLLVIERRKITEPTYIEFLRYGIDLLKTSGAVPFRLFLLIYEKIINTMNLELYNSIFDYFHIKKIEQPKNLNELDTYQEPLMLIYEEPSKFIENIKQIANVDFEKYLIKFYTVNLFYHSTYKNIEKIESIMLELRDKNPFDNLILAKLFLSEFNIFYRNIPINQELKLSLIDSYIQASSSYENLTCAFSMITEYVQSDFNTILLIIIKNYEKINKICVDNNKPFKINDYIIQKYEDDLTRVQNSLITIGQFKLNYGFEAIDFRIDMWDMYLIEGKNPQFLEFLKSHLIQTSLYLSEINKALSYIIKYTNKNFVTMLELFVKNYDKIEAICIAEKKYINIISYIQPNGTDNIEGIKQNLNYIIARKMKANYETLYFKIDIWLFYINNGFNNEFLLYLEKKLFEGALYYDDILDCLTYASTLRNKTFATVLEMIINNFEKIHIFIKNKKVSIDFSHYFVHKLNSDNIEQIYKLICIIIEKERIKNYKTVNFKISIWEPYSNIKDLNVLRYIRKIILQCYIMDKSLTERDIDLARKIHDVGFLYIRQGKLVGDKLLEFLGVEEAFYVEGQINDIIETNKYQQKQLDEHLLSINYLKEENIALKRRVSSCESDVSDLRSENNRLKNRVSGLEDDVSTLYSRVRSLESSVSCL
jgi:FtsZ-binding cell division protein ZapB